MKRTDYKTYLSQAFMALALMGAVSACVEEDLITDNFRNVRDEGLSVIPTISDGTVVTRAESVEALNEKQLNTLDVFVEHVTDGTGDGTFMRQYHLVASDENQITENLNLLANNWRAEGLVLGEKYNIYVATNNTQTKDPKDLSTFNVTALKALVADEITDGLALLDGTGNIAAPWSGQFADTPSGNIYKQYIPEDQIDDVRVGSYNSIYGYTAQKEFMMDGIIKNWTPDATTRDQVFGAESNVLTLNRAAAKIVLNLKFDEDFLHSLTHNKKVVNGTTTWEEKPAAEKCEITGAPAWRYNNFAFGAPVFAPETQGAGVEVHNSATILYHPYDFEIDDDLTDDVEPLAAQIITYTYPNKWAEADYADKAPSLVVSVGFKENGVTNYNYYRIPLVKSTVTEIERNHIYVVNATIATHGSDLHEDTHEIEDVQYAVLPWNDAGNSDAISSDVESVQHYYFNANPKVYTLRGDGDQSVVINYSKAAGTKVNWKLFTYDADGNQTGVVENDATGAVRAWFYNANGDFTTRYGEQRSSTNTTIDYWNNMGVTITQSNEGTSGSSGTITVTSTALTNKAIKYIRFRVYLDETNDQGVSLEDEYHEDILIRHFPTDNIQNIEGQWSSYTGTTSKVTLTTTELTQAQAWATQYGVSYQTETIPERTEYINYATYNANSSDTEHYHISGPTETTYQVFHTMVQNATNRQNANSQANAVADGGEGHSYYWGTGATRIAQDTSTEPAQWDYRIRTGGMFTTRYDWYKYSNYYTATYTHTIDSYIQYSVTYTTQEPSTWVDWEDRASHSPQRVYEINYTTNGSQFLAKVYENGTIYRITETRNGNTYTTTRGNTDNLGGLTNNHMYVIQISSTSDEYVLGRPFVNESTHQSQDNVVSPAFMIASQLGAVTQFTGNNAATNAATHCSRYMEVTEDGERFTGWRLPTQSEIGVISGYQNGNINNVIIPSTYQVMTPVLTGDLYWCLSGNRIRTSDNQVVATGNAYLRCVRDLSAEEVKKLNGFDKIQEKYR